MDRTLEKCKLNGVIQLPASKSDAQRAILAAALCSGKSKIYNSGNSDDVLGMIGALVRLGALAEHRDDVLEVKGISTPQDSAEIYVGESGLALRLLVTVCAALGGDYTFEGKGTLRSRSHLFFEEFLKSDALDVETTNGHLPIRIKGRLISGSFSVDGSPSSQYISGLLMALPLLDGNSQLLVKELKSKPYVEMTLRTLDKFGVRIDQQNMKVFTISGGQSYQATEYFVESDWSAAAFWLVAATIGHSVQVKGLNRQSLQADRMVLDALSAANCGYEFEHDVLTVDASGRKCFQFDATDCPDLFPALVVLAAFCDGLSEIHGAERLKNKESDRGKTLKQEFGKLGLKIDLMGDRMLIHGGGLLRGAEVDSHGDHRIAMALAIVSTRIEGRTTIRNAEAVGKSYPDFWKDLSKLIIQKRTPNL